MKSLLCLVFKNLRLHLCLLNLNFIFLKFPSALSLYSQKEHKENALCSSDFSKL